MLDDKPLPSHAPLGFWLSEVERAQAQVDVRKTECQENLDYYTGKPLASAPDSHYVNVNVDFYQVEQKEAQLFYETPELQLTPGAPFEGADSVLHAHKDLLNELLGPDHADVMRTVQKSLKECLCTAGVGPTKICYEPTTVNIPAPSQPGQILGPLQPDVQVPIHEKWCWDDFSSQKLLGPADYRDTDGDAAPWLGMRFRMPRHRAIAKFQLPPDFEGAAGADTHVFDADDQQPDEAQMPYVEGTEIWYKASVYDETVIHPELYRQLVLIDGLDAPAQHRDSPYQELDARGRLTADSMVGNPIHPLWIRDVPDSFFVPSDSQMTRPLVRELCLFRTQMVKERDASRQRVLYDAEKLVPEVVAKIVAGEQDDMIPVPSGTLAAGIGSVMAPVSTGSTPRQTYVANDYIERDIQKTLAVGASANPSKQAGEHTATEIASIDRNMNVRLDAERARVLRWYLKGVAKFSSLVCRYMTPDIAAQYLGQREAQMWQQWNKKAQDGRMAFTAKPDSQIRLDAADERRQLLQLYQFVAKDPNSIRVTLLKSLFTKFGLDPSTHVVEQLPEKGPEPPSIGYSFKGEDFIGPQAPIVLEILAQAGVRVTPQAVDASSSQMFQQMALGIRDASGKATPPKPRGPEEHGGVADQVRPLSKGQAQETGAPEGRSPMGPQ